MANNETPEKVIKDTAGILIGGGLLYLIKTGTTHTCDSLLSIINSCSNASAIGIPEITVPFDYAAGIIAGVRKSVVAPATAYTLTIIPEIYNAVLGTGLYSQDLKSIGGKAIIFGVSALVGYTASAVFRSGN